MSDFTGFVKVAFDEIHHSFSGCKFCIHQCNGIKRSDMLKAAYLSTLTNKSLHCNVVRVNQCVTAVRI